MDGRDAEAAPAAVVSLEEFLEHLFRGADAETAMCAEVLATLTRVRSSRAVGQLASTLTTWVDGLVGDDLLSLDRDLAARNYPSISSTRGRDRVRVPQLLARGRLETREDYRVVDAFSGLVGALGPSPDERHRLLQLLDGYSEDDQESADTAPLAVAWRAAARDLDIRFVSPHRLSGADDREIWCCGLLPDFGSPNGAVILGRFASADASAMADEAACYTSGLNPLYYEYYDRAQFEETLNDWGWFGDADAVPWLPVRRAGGRGSRLVAEEADRVRVPHRLVLDDWVVEYLIEWKHTPELLRALWEGSDLPSPHPPPAKE